MFIYFQTANNSTGTFMTRSIRSDPGEGVVLRSDSANSIVQSNADSTQNVNIVMPSDSKNNIQNSNQNIPHSNSAGSVQVLALLLHKYESSGSFEYKYI
ncbi:UNVERIFIED_CONTAM: hypothetical protein NCL1_18486 [Trichonephila clavipes]